MFSSDIYIIDGHRARNINGKPYHVCCEFATNPGQVCTNCNCLLCDYDSSYVVGNHKFNWEFSCKIPGCHERKKLGSPTFRSIVSPPAALPVPSVSPLSFSYAPPDVWMPQPTPRATPRAVVSPIHHEIRGPAKRALSWQEEKPAQLSSPAGPWGVAYCYQCGGYEIVNKICRRCGPAAKKARQNRL